MPQDTLVVSSHTAVTLSPARLHRLANTFSSGLDGATSKIGINTNHNHSQWAGRFRQPSRLQDHPPKARRIPKNTSTNRPP